MNSCEKIQEMISSMLDGELRAADEALVREHIAKCENCAAMYEDFAALSGELREDLAEVPASLHSRIMKGVRTSKKPKKPMLIAMRPYMGAAACLIIVAGVVLAAQAGNLGGDLAVGSTSKLMEMPAAPADFQPYSFEYGTEAEEAPAAPEAPAEPAAPAAPEAPAEPEMPAEPVPPGTYDDDYSNIPPWEMSLESFAPYIPGTEIEEASISVWYSESLLVKEYFISSLEELGALLSVSSTQEDAAPVDMEANAFLKLICNGEEYYLKLYFSETMLIVETSEMVYIAQGSVEELLSIK